MLTKFFVAIEMLSTIHTLFPYDTNHVEGKKKKKAVKKLRAVQQRYIQ